MAPPAFLRAVSVGVYDGSMRGAIHALKYDRMTGLSQELGRRLATAIAGLADGGPDRMLVVPVPLHGRRMAERGFNQARSLAEVAVKSLRQTHPQWRLRLSEGSLVRKRSTESQAGLTPRQRRLNLRGAFFVADSEAVRGQHILLVDDIYTTGATARACSKVLIDAGAASVRVATLARAQRQFPRAAREAMEFVRVPLQGGSGKAPDSSKPLTVH